MKTENFPILKIFIPFIIGIIAAYKLDFSHTTIIISLIVLLVAILLSVILFVLKSYKLQFVLFCSISVTFFSIGTLTALIKLQPPQTNKNEVSGNYILRLNSEQSIKEKSVKFEAEVINSDNRDLVNQKVILYIVKCAESLELKYGDVIAANTTFSRIKLPNNLDCFDNQKFMRRRKIYFTGYIGNDRWKYFGASPASLIKKTSQDTRARMTQIYESAGMTGDELSILKAILLGDDETLDPELKLSYSSAGVSHILCVSGMHVGIIFMIINFLLQPLDLFKTTRIIKLLIVTISIWAYANITGLAPSVSRSATMFTFVAFGQILRRNTTVFHSLYASAFILLILNPLLLFEVGFQLSYLAVFGIVLFQPVLFKSLCFKSKIINYFWELITVSLAAQIGTFPISVFYFSQFPNYFVISNLCVITLSFVIVISGVVLLPISFIPLIAEYLSEMLTLEIKIMNKIIVTIKQLPFSTTNNIDYSLMQVIIIYAIIFALYLFVTDYKKSFFWYLLLFCTSLAVSFPIKKMTILKKCDFRTLHINNCTAIVFNYKGQCVILSDSIKSKGDKLFEYNIKNYVKKRTLNTEIVSFDSTFFDNEYICKRGNLVRFNKNNYLIVSDECPYFDSLFGLDIDYLILRHNPKIPPEQLLKKNIGISVIADGSNRHYLVEKWRKCCNLYGLDFTYTGDIYVND